MFKRLRPPRDPVTIVFDGREIVAEAGETIAAALLAAGITVFRRAAEDGSVRGPLCMIGNCFECLVWIDTDGKDEGEGVEKGSRQACRTRVRPGLRLRTHPGLASSDGLGGA